jgi:hypothetical protein
MVQLEGFLIRVADKRLKTDIWPSLSMENKNASETLALLGKPEEFQGLYYDNGTSLSS